MHWKLYIGVNLIPEKRCPVKPLQMQTKHLGQFLDPEFLGGLLSLFALVTHVELRFIQFLEVCETPKAII